MSDRKPQKGDRCRVTFEATYEGEGRDGQPARVKVVKGGMPALVSVADGSVFEVLESADDPSKDLTGSIRRTRTVTCIARERDGGPDYHRWIAVELNESFTDEHMRGSRVIGAVPGTPAAEAEKQDSSLDADDEDPLTPEYRAHVGRSGDGHNTPVAGCGFCRPSREPRVFSSDGPEPPEDVSCLMWMFDTATTARFLQRHNGGWTWVRMPGSKPEFDETPLRWCPGRGEFREVLS